MKSREPTTRITVPTLNRNAAKQMAFHGTLGGGLINCRGIIGGYLLFVCIGSGVTLEEHVMGTTRSTLNNIGKCCRVAACTWYKVLLQRENLLLVGKKGVSFFISFFLAEAT